jgi:predicted transposase YbfD/YdcC
MRTKEYFEEFNDVETEKEYNGYFFSVKSAITIAVCGTFCGLRNMKQIHQWARHERIRSFLNEVFCIEFVPCYSWFTQVLGLIKPKSFSECFTNWVSELVGEVSDKTISFDGKTVRSTAKMKGYKNPLHIVSAQIAELGVTFGQTAVQDKSNEIPAVRELLKLLEIRGCVIVADALNCQKETAALIVEKGADYLLCAKGNQSTLESEISDFVQDKTLRSGMDHAKTVEKNRERIETRIAYTTCDIDWLSVRSEWSNASCVGAINRKFKTDKGDTNEWHYYISSRELSAEELLARVRNEWSVETMHWLLDVDFSEDFCRVAEQNTQENLNTVRKVVLNSLRLWKTENNSKAAFTHLMLDCLLEPSRILGFLV